VHILSTIDRYMYGLCLEHSTALAQDRVYSSKDRVKTGRVGGRQGLVGYGCVGGGKTFVSPTSKTGLDHA
jgi:hypothetical protein